MKILSINTSEPQKVIFNGKELITSIYKKPVSKKVQVTSQGIQGDRQADLLAHGGIDKAIYAYSYKHYEYWGNFLRKDFSEEYGLVGENLTIDDFDEKNITTALEKLNNFGKPVLIFNEDASYVHVVALTPNGKSMKSGKWGGISVPSCISYFPKRKDSFTEKGVNYAFKSVDDLTIWTKK